MRKIYLLRLALAVLLTSTVGHAQANGGSKTNSKSTRKSAAKVSQTPSGVRLTYVPRSVGVYGGVGGQQPTRHNPRGEKRIEGGFAFKFGNPNATSPKTSPATVQPSSRTVQGTTPAKAPVKKK